MIVLYAYVIGMFAFIAIAPGEDVTSEAKMALLWPYHIIRIIF